MRKCFKCNVKINSKTEKCPLCESPFKTKEKGEDVFPIIKDQFKKHTIIFKILQFLTIFGSLVCIYIDYTVTTKITWSFFVIFAMIIFWITLITGIKRRRNFLKLLFAELNLVILASIITDYRLGFSGFSLTYVLPFSIISYITCVFILRIFMNKYLKDYIFYTYINCFIGILPIIFILRDTIKVTWPSSICVLLSILMMLTLFIFNRKQVTDELERKLHF